jgi:hypothetical protein
MGKNSYLAVYLCAPRVVNHEPIYQIIILFNELNFID